MKNKAFEELNLDEILFLNDKEMYNRYFEEIKKLNYNRIAGSVISKLLGKSLSKIYDEILSAEELCRSQDFFFGDLVILYNGISEQKSKKIITCDFSGGIIYPGSKYIKYRPILENISKNEVYVLKKTLKVECGYEYELPSNITELETLQRNIYLETDLNDGIDYSHLSQRVGKELVLQKLRKGVR